MLFNSVSFLGFFALVYAAYLTLAGPGRSRHEARNGLLLASSYVFYGAWDWRFLSLLWLSTLVDYASAWGIGGAPTRARARLWLTLSVVTNLGILGTFKYLDFFLTSAQQLLHALGSNGEPWLLSLTLPLGISFYTFQSLSYTIDVYRGQLAPTRRLDHFALYIAFFPQLVAGPIERATTLLPQIQNPRPALTASQLNAGCLLLLWGYFKKVVVADNAGLISDYVFNHYRSFDGLDLVLGALAFALQIYADFSGYTDIARGLAKLLGFELGVNFRRPYFALGLKDFWSRWHLSLSTWLRDYLYIPLGGNRQGAVKAARNLLATFLLGGLWHGAAWHYVLWGAYHAALLLGERLLVQRLAGATRPSRGALQRALTKVLRWIVTFSAVVVGWVIFRSEDTTQCWYFLTQWGWGLGLYSVDIAWRLAWLVLPVFVFESLQHSADHWWPLRTPWLARALLYASVVLAIVVFGLRESVEFIYFQF